MPFSFWPSLPPRYTAPSRPKAEMKLRMNNRSSFASSCPSPPKRKRDATRGSLSDVRSGLLIITPFEPRSSSCSSNSTTSCQVSWYCTYCSSRFIISPVMPLGLVLSSAKVSLMRACASLYTYARLLDHDFILSCTAASLSPSSTGICSRSLASSFAPQSPLECDIWWTSCASIGSRASNPPTSGFGVTCAHPPSMYSRCSWGFCLSRSSSFFAARCCCCCSEEEASPSVASSAASEACSTGAPSSAAVVLMPLLMRAARNARHSSGFGPVAPSPSSHMRNPLTRARATPGCR
mmetsp:Transcript_42997/g.102292  ORF Transcript_42997/g.102292 Transcript_42997/m.102292 type:complete len:293 (-) Transcript_42997:116-994(-)